MAKKGNEKNPTTPNRLQILTIAMAMLAIIVSCTVLYQFTVHRNKC